MKKRMAVLAGVALAMASGGVEGGEARHVLPRGAAACGYVKCVVNERPKASEISPDRKGRHKWYSGQWWSNPPPGNEKYTMTNGVLCIEAGGEIVSAPPSFREEHVLPLLPGKDGFYVEFEYSISDNGNDYFPAVWLMPAEKNQHQDCAYPGGPKHLERWMELDVDEGHFGPGMTGSVHNWWGVAEDGGYRDLQNGNNVQKRPLDRTKVHRFGASYCPRKGTVYWWLDDKYSHGTGWECVPEVGERQNFYFIIGAQWGPKRKPYRLYLHAVRAFVPAESHLKAVEYVKEN